MLKFFSNLFSSQSRYTYVFMDDPTCGGYMVFAEEFPHVTAIGKTKDEALRILKADIKAIKKLRRKDFGSEKQTRYTKADKRQPASV